MKNSNKITKIALLTAILCIISPISINISTVPFSFATLIIMIYSTTFDKWTSFFSIIIYILLGAIGLPVFSMYQGGLSKLLSVTGGFIFAYPIMSLFISTFYKNNYNIVLKYIILFISNIILYTIGTAYFCFISKTSITYGLTITVLPFMITDNIKIVITILINDKLIKILNKINI